MADVARRIEFNIDTARLGPIHCGSLKVKAVSELRRLRKGFVHAPRDFTCLLLSKVGTRPNPNPADRTLTISLEEAASLSDAELNVFASRFLEGNSWLKNSVEDNGSTNAAPETAMAAMEQLAECFEERTGKLAAWLRGFGWLVSTASDFEAGDAITKVRDQRASASGHWNLQGDLHAKRPSCGWLLEPRSRQWSRFRGHYRRQRSP